MWSIAVSNLFKVPSLIRNSFCLFFIKETLLLHLSLSNPIVNNLVSMEANEKLLPFPLEAISAACCPLFLA
jgi:hypothetical protein